MSDPSSSSVSAASESVLHIKIEMTSDTICPWCFIGRKRLLRALSLLDDSRISVQWHYKPFFLDATLPEQSVSKLAHYRGKFGEARMATMVPRMVATGKTEGIHFSYGGNIGSTLRSHRLVKYVQQKHAELETRLMDELFHQYFECESDISKIDVLSDIAASLGLDRDTIHAFLSSKQLEGEVQKEVISAYRSGIQGVPHFLINEQFEVSGGEQPDTFVQVFQRLHAPFKADVNLTAPFAASGAPALKQGQELES